MKHIFIINPHAGAQSCEDVVKEAVKPFEKDYDIELYVKQHVGDSYDTVRRYRSLYPNEDLRFYACGGDGTLRETAIACIGVKDVAFTSFAQGSGNDYVKYYGGPNEFRDIERLFNGIPEPIDMMRVKGNQANTFDRNYDGDNDSTTTWAMNATHFGLDARVAKTMDRLRRVPIIGKKAAYPTAVALGFLTAMRNRCTVYADGKQLNEKDILLCTACNGTHVGGSYFCAPRSKNNDGLLEICLVRPASHIRFLGLMKDYQNGKHLDNPKCKDLIHYCQARRIIIEGPEGFCVSLDGELFYSTHIVVENIQHAVQFIRPAEK